ncbi:metalloregulator ArsR/SmtB family transcription factor [Paenibacillus phyllosphaerae]|nr:metalloregulator ArsR/SmtB family transcription factor [Paenibacillus phyllosphaerae]
MQLDKIVSYHKALADPTRMRMLILLSEGELTGLALAGKLCISPATVTHHAAKLRAVSLVNERREKNAIYFSLNHYFLQAYASAMSQLINQRASEEPNENEPMDEKNERLKQSVLKNFMTAEGKLKHIPSQLKKKRIVLEYLAEKLEPGKSYTEKEINRFIEQFHPDYATIRREFIMHAYLFREQEIYERNPREMWEKWETLS